VAIELEADTVATLRKRFADTNVEVLQGDATDMPFEEGSFDSVGCFTMLHHVPTPALQNKVFAEALRVLRPGGTMIASDSLPSTDLHDFHIDDVYNPIDPASLLTRLQAVGFGPITISVDYAFTFRARKPAAG
jgi:SAM-dependent methyltransferase